MSALAVEAPDGAGFSYRGAALSLREFRPGDAADIQALHADARVRALLPDAQPLHEARWAQTFATCLGDFYRRHPGLGIWRCAVPHAGGERFAGWFSLMPVQASPGPSLPGMAPGDAELGSRLLPEHWGSGLSPSGGEVLLDHAFLTLGLRRVWGICHPHNRPAQGCLQMLGFTPQGRALYEGQPSDHHALDAATWLRLRTLGRRQRLRAQRSALPPTSHPGPP